MALVFTNWNFSIVFFSSFKKNQKISKNSNRKSTNQFTTIPNMILCNFYLQTNVRCKPQNRVWLCKCFLCNQNMMLFRMFTKSRWRALKCKHTTLFEYLQYICKLLAKYIEILSQIHKQSKYCWLLSFDVNFYDDLIIRIGPLLTPNQQTFISFSVDFAFFNFTTHKIRWILNSTNSHKYILIAFLFVYGLRFQKVCPKNLMNTRMTIFFLFLNTKLLLFFIIFFFRLINSNWKKKKPFWKDLVDSIVLINVLMNVSYEIDVYTMNHNFISFIAEMNVE